MARRAGMGREPSQRQRRVGEELRHALAHILSLDELRDPDLAGQSITVTEVRVSPDLHNATAFVMPLGGEGADRIIVALGRAATYLRGRVAKEVRLRVAPRLIFRLDDSFANAARIDSLLAPSPLPAEDEGDDGA